MTNFDEICFGMVRCATGKNSLDFGGDTANITLW